MSTAREEQSARSFEPAPVEDSSSEEEGEADAPLISLSACRCRGAGKDQAAGWVTQLMQALVLPAAFLGLLLAAAATVRLQRLADPGLALHARPPERVKLTPRQLLESPDFAEVATDNAMSLARGAIDSSRRPEVRAYVETELCNISASIWELEPEVGRQLDALLLTPEEQDGLLTMMRSVSDPRVHSLGREVGVLLLGVLRGTAADADEFDAKRQLANSLEPRLAEIRQLRDEVFPPALRGPEDSVGEGGPSSLTLDTEGLKFVTSAGDWEVEVDIGPPERAAEAARRLTRSRSPSRSSPASPQSRGTPDVGDPTLNALMSVMRLRVQAYEFFEQVQHVMARKYGVHVPDIPEAMRGVRTSKLKRCATHAVLNTDFVQGLHCCIEFWSIVMQVMQNIVASIGPVTTSTRQTRFRSFEELLG